MTSKVMAIAKIASLKNSSLAEPPSDDRSGIVGPKGGAGVVTRQL